MRLWKLTLGDLLPSMMRPFWFSLLCRYVKPSSEENHKNNTEQKQNFTKQKREETDIFAWIDMNRRTVNLILKVIRINIIRKWIVGTSHDHQQDLSSSLWLVRGIEQNIDETCSFVVLSFIIGQICCMDETYSCWYLFWAKEEDTSWYPVAIF